MEKLTKFNQDQTVSIKGQTRLGNINQNLDKVLTLTPKGMNKIKRFFVNNAVADNYLSINDFNVDEKIATRLKKRLRKGNPQGKESYSLEDLPFHIDDHDWLVQYTLASIKRLDPHANPTLAEVRKFMETEPTFQQALKNFERELIRAKILCTPVVEPSAEDKKRYAKLNNVYYYEEVFRNQILFDMELLGVDRHTTEIALEENALLWRPREMKHTFADLFYPAAQRPTDPMEIKRWSSLSRAHEAEWLKYREYQYYRAHKDVIDEAGVATANMKMSQDDLWDVMQEVDQYNTMRHTMLRNHQQNLATQKVRQTTDGRTL